MSGFKRPLPIAELIAKREAKRLWPNLPLATAQYIEGLRSQHSAQKKAGLN